RVAPQGQASADQPQGPHFTRKRNREGIARIAHGGQGVDRIPPNSRPNSFTGSGHFGGGVSNRATPRPFAGGGWGWGAIRYTPTSLQRERTGDWAKRCP